MKHRSLYVTLIGAALLVAGCTPTCKGDSCSRPQSSKDKLVIWWPSQTRVEPGPAGESPDYHTVTMER